VNRLIHRSRPARGPSKHGGAVAVLRMRDDVALSRSLAIISSKLFVIRVVAFIRTLAGKAGEASEPLRPAKRLDISIQNLIGGRTLRRVFYRFRSRSDLPSGRCIGRRGWGSLWDVRRRDARITRERAPSTEAALVIAFTIRIIARAVSCEARPRQTCPSSPCSPQRGNKHNLIPGTLQRNPSCP